MNYPRKLYANVLLLDGKIINWKTGEKTWEDERYFNNRQPISKLMGKFDRLSSETFKFTANNSNENKLFFESYSKEFYQMFELHEDYSKSMFKPY